MKPGLQTARRNLKSSSIKACRRTLKMTKQYRC